MGASCGATPNYRCGTVPDFHQLRVHAALMAGLYQACAKLAKRDLRPIRATWHPRPPADSHPASARLADSWCARRWAAARNPPGCGAACAARLGLGALAARELLANREELVAQGGARCFGVDAHERLGATEANEEPAVIRGEELHPVLGAERDGADGV